MATTTSSATNKNYSEFFKAFSDFSVPGVDFNHLFSLQRRNLEALSAANQVVAESVQAISRRQAELLQSQVERFLQTAREVLSSGSPEAGASRQADLA